MRIERPRRAALFKLAHYQIFGFDIGEEDPATAGRYRLVTDEDEMLGLSFLAFPRTATMLHIPAISISDHPNQVFHVNSAELAAALMPFGGFLVTQQAAKRMVPRGRGAILLTGATASVKGFALSSAFAMGKLCADWRKARRASWGPRAFTSPISLLMAACAARDTPIRPTSLTAPSIRTQSPRPISTCCASIGAHGPSRSRSGRGSMTSDHRAQPG
jgi:hypothetical protein